MCLIVIALYEFSEPYLVMDKLTLPVSKSVPESPSLPSLNNFHDPAVFSHVAQMWCHFPSFADTEVCLKRAVENYCQHHIDLFLFLTVR